MSRKIHEPIKVERPDPASHHGIMLALVELADENAGSATVFAPLGEFASLRALMDTGSVTLLEKTLMAIWQHGRIYGGKELAERQEHQANNAQPVINGLMRLAEEGEAKG